MVNTMLLSDLIRFAAISDPDSDAVIFGDQHIPFAQMEGRIHRLANGLLDLARPGDWLRTVPST